MKAKFVLAIVLIANGIASAAVPDGKPWGNYPRLAGEVTSRPGETHNVLACSFVPGSFKGIIFISGPAMVAQDQGVNFGPELSVLANSLIGGFGGKAQFLYTMPSKTLDPKITTPSGLPGDSRSIEISGWMNLDSVLNPLGSAVK